MLWSVGNRFKFSDAEIGAMHVSRLRFWYEGHQALNQELKDAETALRGGANGG
jgi:hypothetical protein